MPTSVYFNNQNATREQFLVEDFIIESIRNHGIDVWYIPRTSQSQFDALFGDDPVKYFDRAIKLDMYMETFNDFEGQQEFFSKFGLNIDKSARMALARRTFERYVQKAVRANPQEGDLIYLPVQAKLMEIRRVEEEKNFFQLGKLAPYMYGLSMETFKYNGEFINTGMQEVDSICDAMAPSLTFTMVADAGQVSYDRGEIVYQGTDLANSNCKGIVVTFDRPSLLLKVRNIKGTFAANVDIIGDTTGATFELDSYDKQENTPSSYDTNVLIENEADAILDFSETNPFGEP